MLTEFPGGALMFTSEYGTRVVVAPIEPGTTWSLEVQVFSEAQGWRLKDHWGPYPNRRRALVEMFNCLPQTFMESMGW